MHFFPNGPYFLLHAADRDLWTSYKGTKGENPKAFRCELDSDVMGDELCHRLNQALPSHASEKRFEYIWSVTVEDQGSEKTHELYAKVVVAKLPAGRHLAAYLLRLHDLRGIEALQELCQGKGEIQTQIGTFDLGEEDDYGELFVVTSASGHRLELRLSTEDHLEKVQQLAGGKFSQI
jgi:hypothetical protein